MKVVKVKIYNAEGTHIHYDYPYNDSYTLCGLAMADESGREEKTKEKVDCPHCLEIVKFCKRVRTP